MEEKIERIKKWLGTGSINVFGMPFSGKDTVGVHLAEVLGGKFLSSGIIIRAAEDEDKEMKKEHDSGQLINSDKFRALILPYFAKKELSSFPLVLSSVGRWSGEEFDVIEHTEKAGHPIKAVILLNLSEAEVRKRWHASKESQDRGDRNDDRDESILDTRINEFKEKTIPVIETYQKRGLIAPVNANGTREEVFANVIDILSRFASANSEEREVPLLDENQNVTNGIEEVDLHKTADESPNDSD